MENKNDSNVVEKAEEEIKQTEQAVDSASKLAANMASGNVAGAIKEGINLAKNKKVRRRMKIQMIMQILAILLVLSIIISIIATLFSIFNSVAKKMGNLVNIATEYNTNMWKYLTNDYWIDLSKKIEVEYTDKSGNTRTETRTVVEQYMYELDTLGISLKELNLLGEADYNDPNLLENPNNKAIVEKYIKSFVVADLISTQIHRRGGNTIGETTYLDSTDMLSEIEDIAILSDKIDGGVYLYRVESTAKGTGKEEVVYDLEKEKKYVMKYTEYGDFEKKIDEYNSIEDNVKNDKDVESIFAMNSDGDLVFARVEGKVTETEEEGDVHSRKIKNEKKAIIEVFDYKQAIAEYSLPYEFLVELCMVTQNPEYVFHVAQLALGTKIDLIITDNKEVTIRNKKTTKEYTKDDGKKGKKTIWTTTTKETTTPELLIKTVNSWNAYKNNTCNFIVTEETNGEDGDKTTKIKNDYSLLQGKVIRKSDNFLGLLRNSLGVYVPGTVPYFQLPGTKFNRNGINVRYKLPNRSKSADPLSMLKSGEQELYALMEQDAEKQNNEKTDENEDIIQISKSNSVVEKRQSRTEPLIETIKYFLTYPEQEYYDLSVDQIFKILGGYNILDGDKIKYDDVDDEELEILYKICQAEAGGSSEEEIGHVASVILNRVKCSKWPNTIKAVVFQKSQFAPVSNGSYEKAVPSEKTKKAVNNVIENGDTTGGAVYFRTKKSAESAGIPTSSEESPKKGYIYLFTDPNTHVFLTCETALKELKYKSQTTETEPAKGKLKDVFPNGIPTTKEKMQEYLVTVSVPITTKSGKKTTQKVTVHKAIANDLKNVLQKAQDAGFRVYEVQGFSWRNVSGSGTKSQHSYGLAIDINVKENCQIKNGKITAGSFWKPEENEYSIPKDGVLVKAFKAIGWGWGGTWKSSKDYMHFSYTGV